MTRRPPNLTCSETATRWAEARDADAVDAFLCAHADHAMFPLSNLRNHGLTGGGGDRSCRYFLTFHDGVIRGLVGVADGGSVMPVGAPDLTPLRAAIAGVSVTEILGETRVARLCQTVLGLDQAPCNMTDDEPHFTLALTDLVMPDTDGLFLGPLAAVPREQAISWRATYAQEVLGDAPGAAIERAMRDVAAFLAADTHRVLFRGTAPVSMTGFNARLPEIVQIGAVFTPPELRGQGLARAAVALHLCEARAAGARRAVLFAASRAAARAYTAIGFRQIGQYSLILFSAPQRIVPCP